MYCIVPESIVLEQIAVLPAEVFAGELHQWNGQPQHDGNPEGAVRRRLFGSGGVGQAEYLILKKTVRGPCAPRTVSRLIGSSSPPCRPRRCTDLVILPGTLGDHLIPVSTAWRFGSP